MIYSLEQNDVYDFCKNEIGSLSVSAKPGSGKTTTLIYSAIPGLLKRGLSYEEILILMFSKSIQIEFEMKAKKAGIRMKFDKDKLKRLSTTLGIRNYDIFKLVNLGKNEGAEVLPGKSGIEFWNYIADSYSLDLSQQEVNQGQKLWSASVKDKKTCDYSDMVYCPVFYDLKLSGYKTVLVDESQDCPALRIEFLEKCCQNAQIIAVGDPNQSIFAWNGADAGAMEKIEKRFSTKTLPLSVTWRCSKAVTAECNKIFPGMNYRADAPEGYVGSLRLSDFSNKTLDNDTFILCRINAPLIKIAFSLLNRGYKCRIQGKEIGNELISFCKKFKWNDFYELKIKLNAYLDKQAGKLLPQNKKLYKALEDKFDIIIELVDKCTELKKLTKEELFVFINLIFSDSGDGIVLSTPYRVKGLERKDVYIYGDDAFFPPPWVEKECELEEEERVKFVAYSRAKENLFLVNIGKAKTIDNVLQKTPETFKKIPTKSDIIDF